MDEFTVEETKELYKIYLEQEYDMIFDFYDFLKFAKSVDLLHQKSQK